MSSFSFITLARELATTCLLPLRNALCAEEEKEEDEHLQYLWAVEKRLKRHMRIGKHWTRRSRRQYTVLHRARRANLQALVQVLDNKFRRSEAARESVWHWLLGALTDLIGGGKRVSLALVARCADRFNRI